MTRLVGILAFLLTACATGDAAQQAAIRDSAGIRIIQNPERAPDSTSWSIATSPRILIGDEEKGERYAFGWVADVLRLSNGRIAVGDGRAQRIHVYDSSGSFIRFVGGPGQGPGEFNALQRLYRLPGDTIVVVGGYEREQAIFFGPTGNHVRTLSPLAFRVGLPDSTFGLPYPRAFFSDGAVLASAGYHNPSRGMRGPDWRKPIALVDSARVLRMLPGGKVLADYGDWITRRSLRYVSPNPRDPRGDGFSFTNAEFFPKPAWVTRGTDLYASTGASFEIRVLDSNGRLSRIIRKVHPPNPISRAWADSVWRDLTSRPQLSYLRLAEADPPTMPTGAPATDRILIDPTGNLWVRNPALARPEQITWFVFDTTGVLRHSIRTPLDIRQVDSDRVVAILQDSLNVQRVGVFELRRRR
jgi:hypothetical protein